MSEKELKELAKTLNDSEKLQLIEMLLQLRKERKVKAKE